MKPKTFKIIGIILIILGILCVIPTAMDNGRTYTAYAVDGTPFTEHLTQDNTGYAIAAVIGGLGLLLLIIGLAMNPNLNNASRTAQCVNCQYPLQVDDNNRRLPSNYYCPRCGMDNQGFTLEQNQTRFKQDEKTISTN